MSAAYLMDSHTALWAVTAPEKLARPARLLLADGNNAVFFSPATVWELSLKAAKGKLKLPDQFEAELLAQNFVELPIISRHARSSTNLPMYHGDPFDRLLVAQALAERLILVTRDTMLSSYGVAVVSA